MMTQATALLAAILLAGSVALAGVQPAAAYTSKNGAYQAQNENEKLAVTIKEMLRVSWGTVLPDVRFVYDVTPVSVDGVESGDATGTMPELGPAELDTSQMVCGTSCVEDDNIYRTIVYYGQTSDILASAVFSHAGVYVYRITERPDTNPQLDVNHEKLSYSPRTSELTLVVANKAAGGLYVQSVLGEQLADDIDGGGKVDPMPRPEYCWSCSLMGFNDYYVHTNGAVDPGDPDPVNEATWTMSTTVAGPFANRQHYFTYTVQCQVTPLDWDMPDYYRGYIVQDGVVIDPVDNAAPEDIGADATGKGYSFVKVASFGIDTWLSDNPTTVRLKHGQSLHLVDAPVGTFCIASLKDGWLWGYSTSIDLVEGGKPFHYDDDGKGAWIIIYEGENSANFTHTRKLVTPTGLTSHTAPFAGLIAILVTAMAVVVIVKTRARRAASVPTRRHTT